MGCTSQSLCPVSLPYQITYDTATLLRETLHQLAHKVIRDLLELCCRDSEEIFKLIDLTLQVRGHVREGPWYSCYSCILYCLVCVGDIILAKVMGLLHTLTGGRSPCTQHHYCDSIKLYFVVNVWAFVVYMGLVKGVSRSVAGRSETMGEASLCDFVSALVLFVKVSTDDARDVQLSKVTEFVTRNSQFF